MSTEPATSTTGGRLPDPVLVVAKEKAKHDGPVRIAVKDARDGLSRNKEVALSAGALGLGALAVAAATLGAVKQKREDRDARAKPKSQGRGRLAKCERDNPVSSDKPKRVGNRRHDDAPAHATRDTPGDYEVTGRSVLINKPRRELYAYFRDFQNLPRFMENLKAVRPQGGKTSTWVVKAPAGRTVEVETEVVADRKGELIAWASTPNSSIKTEGRVEFRDAPGGRGTYVTLVIAYDPPGGVVGKWAAKLFRREPEVQARVELKRFKMLMETGEIATSDNQRTTD